MKSIKASFDYDGRHYEFNAKLKWGNGNKPEFTVHKFNEQLILTEEEGRWSIHDCDTGVEVLTDEEMNNISNIILWEADNPDSCALAMLGEFDNCKTEIKGLW